MIALVLAARMALAAMTPAEVLAVKLEVAFALTPAAAHAHAGAAVAAARPGVPADVLAAVAAKESSFNAGLRGRIKTAAGVSKFCGPLQAMSGGRAERCTALTDLRVGYAAGAKELEDWLRGRCRGDLDCALRCHACGNKGVRGACAAYQRSIRARLAAMEAGVRFPPRQRARR